MPTFSNAAFLGVPGVSVGTGVLVSDGDADDVSPSVGELEEQPASTLRPLPTTAITRRLDSIPLPNRSTLKLPLMSKNSV